MSGRYKRDGSDVVGLMHGDARFYYLNSQVRFPAPYSWPISEAHPTVLSPTIISRAFPGGSMPRVIRAILYAACHAKERGSMAGLLLRVNGDVLSMPALVAFPLSSHSGNTIHTSN
jgi:hypothetical protein